MILFALLDHLHMQKFIIVGLLIAFSACSQTVAEKSGSKDFEIGKKLKRLNDKRIKEASGIAASIANPGLLWAHNDSGNEAEIFLLDTALQVKLIVKFPGLANRDWEDITVGPGPDSTKSYVYIGEIGDNFAQYQEKKIYRLEEPLIGDDSVIVINQVDQIRIQLPAKRKDTESLMIDPKTRDLFILSKREDPVVVYRLGYPYPVDSLVTLDSITTVAHAQICGGDISGDGQEILVKNYENVFYWKLKNGETIGQAFKRPPVVLPYEEEPQGEAITFARDGSGYYTLSEIVKGEKTFLMFYKRKH